MDRVKDKVALVTGGASGIGEQCVNLLLKEGAQVVFTDINEDKGSKIIEGRYAKNKNIFFLKQDVSKEEDWEIVIKKTLAVFNKLDILINNASMLLVKNPETTTLQEWKYIMDVNLGGVFLGTKYGIKAMKTRGGSIINISSIEGIIGNPDHAAYSTSKGGTRVFTKSSAIHCAKSGFNIRINSIHPGSIMTPMLKKDLKSHGNIEDGIKILSDLHPIGHIGEPIDIAYGVLYLASDESKFVTGSELIIDGGYTAQ